MAWQGEGDEGMKNRESWNEIVPGVVFFFGIVLHVEFPMPFQHFTNPTAG